MASTMRETLESGDEREPFNPDGHEGHHPSSMNKLALSVAYLGAILAGSDESTVVATYEIISAQFHGQMRGIWLVVAYNLGFCISLPVYGTMSDIHGCKRVLLCAYLIFGLGVSICAVSGSMLSLVAGRATTGIGAAGLEVLISVLIKDMVPPKDVALMRSYTNIVKTAGRGIGAPLGSLIAGTTGWRWSFAGRIPIILGCALLAKLYTPEDNYLNREEKKTTNIDYLGVITFSITMLALTIGLNLDENPSLQIACVIGATISSVLFIWVELFIAENPLVPLRLIRTVGSFWLVQILALGSRDGIRSVVVPYLTRVQGMAGPSASVFIGLMSMGFSSGAVLSGLYIKRFKRCYALCLRSHMVNIVMSILLYISWARDTTTPWGSLVIFPISMGIGVITSAQFVGMTTVAPESASASVIGVYYLCQQLGIIIGSSGAAGVVKNRFTHSVIGKLEGDLDIKEGIIDRVLGDPKYISGLPTATQTAIRVSLQYGYKFVPLLSLCCIVAIIPLLMIGGEGRFK